VAGESRERALELVRRMEQSPRFRQPQVVAEAAEPPGQNAGDNVQFDISTLYVAEGRGTETQETAPSQPQPANGPAGGGY
jgi:hypothetical protein